MNSEVIRVMLIEDNPADAKLIQIMLRDASEKYELTTVPTFREGIDYIEKNGTNFILLDLSLPDSFGMETIENATRQFPSIPIIVLTGREDEEFALDVVKAGAQDYLIKGQIDRGLISKAIRYALERKKLEVNLQHKNVEMLKANKTLDRFVYTISHDLKKPVANIIGLLSLFEKEVDKVPLSDRGKMIYGKVTSSIADLRNMMEDLLESTRNEVAQNISFEEVDMSKIFDKIKQNIDQLISSTGTVFHVDFQLPVMLYSEQDMRSILYNLITNAIIYRSPDRHPSILIKTEKTFKGPCLTVKDNGRGIDMEQNKDKLFVKYQRFHTDVEGTGVGLWLIKEIVEKNGGQIVVESAVNAGTTFKVFL